MLAVPVARVAPPRLLRALAAAVALSACAGPGGDVAPGEEGEEGEITTGVGGGGQGSSRASSGTRWYGAGGEGGREEARGAPYPIVFAHGFFGFESFAGVDFATYFYGVKKHLLETQGEIVFTPAVDPFNDSEHRGAQLLAKVEEILAETGARRVNLVGHSQGGLDVRYVASTRPEIVASVVTVATPHLGTPVADIALELLENEEYHDLLDWFVKVVGMPLYDEAGEETSLVSSMKQLSSPGVAAFNAKYDDAPGVFYASLGGRSDGHDGGDACEPDVPLPFVAKWSQAGDPVDPLLSLPEFIVDGAYGSPGAANDGLVRAEDARWGEFWGCVPADHFDEIGHLFGDGAGKGNAWDHEAFYADLALHLRALGF